MKILVVDEKFDKSKLIQKKVTVVRKNGTIFVRNQWVKKDYLTKDEKSEKLAKEKSELKSKIDSVVGKTKTSNYSDEEKNLRAVGSLISNEIANRLKFIEPVKHIDLKSMADNYNKLFSQYEKGNIPCSVVKSAYEEYQKARNLKNQIKRDYQEKVANQVKDILSQIRPIGASKEQLDKQFGKSKSAVRPVMEKALSFYPTEWIQKSIDLGTLKLTKSKNGNGRGFYKPSKKSNGKIDGTIMLEDIDSLDTGIHEFGHRLEDAVPSIRKLEKEFYERRTEGEQNEQLKKITSGNYKSNEVTKKDDFISPYMGKDYKGHYYELVSMGFELAFTNPKKLLKDKDMADWIFGILATK